ncbi:MAG: linked oxidase domain protein, partial [Frondihabitans sp.]|nr:linked oxidase domain protein [Frondihabitans sp.]
HPAFVATPTSAAEVSAIIVQAASLGLRVVPQATGHGAGGSIGGDTIIIDTRGLDTLTIDPEARVATAGTGLTWGVINTEAEKHGLLGLAGSAATVAIAGFTFGGGLGWLTRPHGMASAALRTVEYVDGWGAIRVASDDAADALDREALWAFRGGGGVGIATRLTFDLYPVGSLYAGYLLWPIEALDAVVGAWANAIGTVGPAVATSISVLHAPPAPPFPPERQGQPLVHLAVASTEGEDGALPLLEAVRGASAAQVDTWAPATANELGGIHLDPPSAVPAIGFARWLSAETPTSASAILSVAASADSPLALIEIRSLGNDAEARDGAETTVPGPFALHAVGALLDPSGRPAIDQAFGAVGEASAGVDVGRSIGSWVEGGASVPDALPADVRDRVARVFDAIDPLQVIARTRYLV